MRRVVLRADSYTPSFGYLATLLVELSECAIELGNAGAEGLPDGSALRWQ